MSVATVGVRVWFVGVFCAAAWGFVAARYGIELGLLAWLVGAAVGLAMRGWRDGRGHGLGLPSALVAVAAIAAGRLLSLWWSGRGVGAVWETARWIDALWIAMAASAAQMMATVALDSKARGPLAWDQRFARAMGPLGWPLRSVRRRRPKGSAPNARWAGEPHERGGFAESRDREVSDGNPA